LTISRPVIFLITFYVDYMALATAENRWVGTDAEAQIALHQKVTGIFQSTLYCTLATCSPEGVPWATPLFFVWDSRWCLYWSSAIASLHSQNLAANGGKASITVYSTEVAQSGVQGLFFVGMAGEVSCDRTTATIMNQLFDRTRGSRPQRSAADYLGTSPRRIYQFTPEQAWITGERLKVGNQLVDTKLQLDLPKV
jgi:Pyridoxamine 5'-phosphate oxidase